MNLGKLLVLIILFVASSFLVLSVNTKKPTIHQLPLKTPTPISFEVSPLPTLKDTTNFPILSAQGVLAVDSDSGVILYQKDIDQKLYPASTTKIMTALVSLDFYKDDDILTIGKLNAIGQSMHLIEGEKIYFKDLLSGLLIYSANDAAEALAQNYTGGRDEFIAKMNEKAKNLNLENTHFVNPTGLDQENHYSTAKDMIRLSEIAMQNKKFASIVKTKEKIVRSTDGKLVHYLTNINKLLGTVDGVEGIKTGWTEEARENLVTFVERNNKKVYIALLGSQDRFGETKELINWIFFNYEWKNLAFASYTSQSP
ncbi:MAG: D-alanyl-D-alanine carboxypeptidase [Candidatus Woesebacteria bacterium]|nr:MAG: D-alanyl-D-alanine carboxypeptidase [Candidatus Woesebacteria bacterium]